jgi:CheY-like chemotaxis protein
MVKPLPCSADGPLSDHGVATVLVVEDVVLVRMLICEYLREAGFNVIEATSGDEALVILGSPMHVDVVFADLYMPNSVVDGIGLARWIRTNKPAVKLVLTSGMADMADRAQDVAPDGGLIEKPYDRRQVAKRLREVLGLGEI